MEMRVLTQIEASENASRFLLELVAAADTGDLFLPAPAFQPKQHFTLGTTEILIFLAVLLTLPELRELGLPVGGQ